MGVFAIYCGGVMKLLPNLLRTFRVRVAAFRGAYFPVKFLLSVASEISFSCRKLHKTPLRFNFTPCFSLLRTFFASSSNTGSSVRSMKNRFSTQNAKIYRKTLQELFVIIAHTMQQLFEVTIQIVAGKKWGLPLARNPFVLFLGARVFVTEWVSSQKKDEVVGTAWWSSPFCFDTKLFFIKQASRL